MFLRLSSSLLLLFISACAATSARYDAGARGITFLHLNDTYRVGSVEDGTRGGFGRVATLIRELKAQGRDVRILHGGDFLYPSLESQLWNGEQMIEAFNYLNALAPMVVVPGNHEFDRRSAAEVSAAIRSSEFPWVAANLRMASDDAAVNEAIAPTYVFEAAGQRIGIFGLTLRPEDGGNARDYIHYEGGYLDVARQSLAVLEAANTDLIVGLTHLHMEDDVRIAELRREFPGFRLVVGGHEHEPEHQLPDANRAEVMKGASNARTIWRIDVDADNADSLQVTTQMIELDERIAEDSDYEGKIADKWRARLLEKLPFLPSRIGEAAVPFDAREETIRNRESNWGSFVADQMRTAFGEDEPADLAFINSGTLRIDDFIADDITFEDIARTFGFSSYLQYLMLNGREFREILEAGYRGEGPSKGYFPQVSGFRVCVDRSQPEGSRILQLQLPGEIGWQEIEPFREYLVVAPEYLVGGGDGYEFPDDAQPSRPGSELKYLVVNAIMSATARGEGVGEAVDAERPRIVFSGEPGAHCF